MAINEKKLIKRINELKESEEHGEVIIKYYNKYYFICPFEYVINNKEVLVKCDSLKKAKEEQYRRGMSI